MKFASWLRKQFNRVRIVLGLLSIALRDREGSWLRLKKAYGVYRTQGWHGLRAALKNYSQRHYPAAEVPNQSAINTAVNRASDHEGRLAVQYFSQLFAQANGDKSSYVPFAEHEPVKTDVKVIAFYLPQYHPIPENDLWWGRGFTEWNNVSKAVPQFIGHYQPHLPGELGFYDLRVLDVQKRQMELARNYGIEGFCYHHYWFGGKKLLDYPVQQVLDHPELDLPFCLCWANENWTRRWDGLDNEVLIAQQHSPEDDLAFIKDIEPALRDSRYIRVNGRPLLVVYRVSLLPDAVATAKRWREYCINCGIGELYLVAAQCFEVTDPRKYGFDALVEFPPHHLAVGAPTINHDLQIINPGYQGGVVDYSYVVGKARQVKKPAFTLFRGVFPSWDNEARKPGRGYTFANSTPSLYRKWLVDSIHYAHKYNNEGEKLVFVNAWNEWGEGAHLEPDRKHGYAYLEATRRAVAGNADEKNTGKIIVVSHDAHPHGAQFLALGIVRAFKRDLHLEVEVVLLDGGRLTKDFAALAPVHDLSDSRNDSSTLTNLAKTLAQRGFTKAIVNTTASGGVVPVFWEAGIESVCLVHELPGVIQSHHLENHAAQISEYAKAVVFPAQIVADGFAEFAAVDGAQQFIRPQGLYRRNKWRHEKSFARAKLRKQLGLNADTRIVLTVGYADHRKGVDLFVECALNILAKRGDIDFIWVGHWGQGMQREIEAILQKNQYKNRIHFVGFNAETALFHAASDVYALTSREDPFPNVVLESFDAGVPVVAFAGTGGATHLVGEVGGLVVPTLDVAKFADAICQLIDSTELTIGLGEAAQNHVDEHFAFRPYLFELCGMLGFDLPKVSVVVPNYNYAQYIEERLASICHQSIPIFELIILDDASTDQSVSSISNWLSSTHTEAKVVINKTNSGSVFAQWQKGILLATGDYIWIAEADDLSDPDFLETVLPPLLSGDVVLSYCDSQQINTHGVVQARNYQEYLRVVSQERWKKTYIENGVEECKSVLAIMNTIPNVSAVLFKREVISAVFRQHSEEIARFKKAGDWVVYIRTLLHGKIAFSPRTANRHRRHEGSVIGGSGQQLLLNEIAEVQQLVASNYLITENVKLQAIEYLGSLKKAFSQ